MLRQIYFSVPDEKGNVAKWSTDHWNIKGNEYQNLEVESLSMCNVENRMVLPEMGFSFFRHACQVLNGQPFFIESQTSHQKALKLMKQAKCGICFHMKI